MYERILVPTDGSALATAAARQAVDLAALAGAEVHALYVVDADAIGFAEPAQIDVEEVRSSLRIQGEEATAAIGELAEAAGVRVVDEVRVGAPAEEILEYGRQADVDLVVMGTHGRSGLARFLLGSVTERVLRAAPVPVLAVPPEDLTPVTDEHEAIERATTAAEAEGYEIAGPGGEPYRERKTWIVPLDIEGGGHLNVHVDATSGEVRTAKIG